MYNSLNPSLITSGLSQMTDSIVLKDTYKYIYCTSSIKAENPSILKREQKKHEALNKGRYVALHMCLQK